MQRRRIRTDVKLPKPHVEVEIKCDLGYDVDNFPVKFSGVGYYREVPETRRKVSSGWVYTKLTLAEGFDLLGSGLTPTHWREIKQTR